MLFHESQVIFEAREELLKTLKRTLEEIDVTDNVSITMFMDYLHNVDVTIQFVVFQEAKWVTNRPLYEACIEYEYERFRQISEDLKAFVQGTMVDFVKKYSIHGKDINMPADMAYLMPALDALEAAFWLGITSAYL